MEISRIFRVSGQELLSLDLWHVFALLLPAIVTTFICIRLRGLYTNDLPVLNPKNWWEFTNRRRRAEFIKEGKRLFTLGRQKYPDSPYKLYTDWGEVVVLPPECAEELKNDTRLESLPIVREVRSSPRSTRLGTNDLIGCTQCNPWFRRVLPP